MCRCTVTRLAGRRREDGYHELDMLMQSVDVFDVVELTPAQAGVSVVSDAPLPEDNTALRAARPWSALIEDFLLIP